MAAIWAGIDAGKTHHHCVAIDESGHRLLSRRVANDEPELLANVLALGEEVTWGIDLADGGAALAIAILLNHDQPVHYISGRAIDGTRSRFDGTGQTERRHGARQPARPPQHQSHRSGSGTGSTCAAGDAGPYPGGATPALRGVR
ncbi:transposase [Streptomyces sp. E5N298]|uniref:IS110 family transposase n=1 Tax=Streptomyces sp. E5N298 TaxID=1851983 RepID=UPI00237A156D|nr:transposase [Streptomyces sp. E5N298]